MVKLANGLKILRENLELRAQIAQLQAEMDSKAEIAAEYLADAELLASMLCRQPAFTDWLLDQDVSSAHERKPSGIRGVSVEETSDLDLALAYAGRVR
jgi:hypothetical protein